MARLIFLPENTDTYLSRRNPLAKLAALIAASIIISVSSGLMTLWIALFLAAVSYSAGIPLIRRLLSVPAILIVAALIAITGYMSSSDAVLSLLEALSFISLFSAAIIFTGSTDTVDLASSLGRLIAPAIGTRAYSLASDAMLVIALLPDIFLSSEEMLNARKARGGRFLAHPAANLSEYAISLMKRLLSRSAALSDALEARSFSRSRERSAPPFTVYDAIMAAGSVGAVVIWISMS